MPEHEVSKTDRELLLEIHGDVKQLRKSDDDHEQRIRAVEKKVWFASGAGVFGALLIKLVTGTKD